MKFDVKATKEVMASKKVVVVGLGRSGKAAVQTLNALGATVTVQDSSPIDKIDPKFIKYLERESVEMCLGEDLLPDEKFDIMVLSPGVSPDLPFIAEARNKGVEVIGELELAYRLSEADYVAITGTNGKTTTTTLTHAIFREGGAKASAVGNIGIPAISVAAESREGEWLIAEVSSFQLETVSEFKPKISAILNLTPDHLNRHKTMEAYGAAKARIFAKQTASDILVINADDADCFALAKGCRARVIPFSRKDKKVPGAYVDEGRIVVADEEGNVHDICGTDEILIPGEHNVENVLAASAIAFFAGISPEVIGNTIRKFPGVEHRIEYCGDVDGVEFYNDSKGTNTDATIIALKALKNNIILIAGGDGKGQDFTELANHLKGSVKAMVMLGRDAGIIAEAAEKAGFRDIFFEKDMNACVNKAVELAEEGDKILLSPACASWDMYDNYEQRGEHFKECVELLLK